MATVQATAENFEKLVEDHNTVIVDFWAEWCGPCKTFGPIFEEASERHPDVLFAKVNTEEQPELAQAFGVRGIPTIVVLREKIGIFSQAGAFPGEVLDEVLGKVAELDMNEVRKDVEKMQSGDEPA